jgi:hypothetical protein
MPVVTLPRASTQQVPRTVWIVGCVLVLLLIVPLAYIILPSSKASVATTHRSSTTQPRPSTSATGSLAPGSPQAVAAAGVAGKTGLKYSPSCAGNQACLSIAGQTLGQAAAAIDFSTAQSGGRECVGYVVQNNNAWQFVNAICGLPGQVTPMVGRNATVHVPGNCARVRTAPSLQSGVAGCLYDGTAVKISGGPVYANSLIWWQTNRGWMAQDFIG